jgi:membrane-associated phospholipid phosphatase
MAIVHIAMFDAVNEVTTASTNPSPSPRRFASYSLRLPPITKPTSVDAAIAAAAHRALTYLYKGQEAQLDYLLSEDRKLIAPNGRDEGEKFGVAAAEAIITARHDDGSRHLEPAVGEPGFPLNTTPGLWTPDPVSRLTVALGGRWSEVAPFAVPSASSFRPPPPPPLTDDVYVRAYNEVKRLGGDGARTPTERPDDQTRAGIFWAYDGTAFLCAPPRLYNQIVRKVVLSNVAAGRRPKLVDYARLVTLVNIAMGDAAISAWEAKYHYQYWRPVTGIRAGALDNRPDTEPDLTWTPLGSPATNGRGPNFTPPFPAYPSGHAVFGGAIFEIMRRFYTDDTPFAFTSDEFNGKNSPAGSGMAPRPVQTRNFSSFREAERENADSRIYLGVHWRFDADAGIAQGNQVGASVFDRILTCVDSSGAASACPLFSRIEDEPAS